MQQLQTSPTGPGQKRKARGSAASQLTGLQAPGLIRTDGHLTFHTEQSQVPWLLPWLLNERRREAMPCQEMPMAVHASQPSSTSTSTPMPMPTPAHVGPCPAAMRLLARCIPSLPYLRWGAGIHLYLADIVSLFSRRYRHSIASSRLASSNLTRPLSPSPWDQSPQG